MTSQNKILTDLHALSAKVLQYEDKSVQSQALKLIPIERITLQTQQQLRQIQSEITKEETERGDESCVNQIFVFHLLKWFKDEFFSWIDQLPCEKCSGPTIAGQQLLHPLSGERIEHHHCKACKHDTLFQRHNSVATLLQTRRGRCGEWANCFTFLCRALGYEVRTIHDATDHAWTEVYSPTQKRWIHCDPCEAKIDSPLLYERGWNKKLSYIIAASAEEVQDVTWRYTADFKSTMKRRTLVSEAELTRTILNINQTRQSSLAPARRHYLLRRQVQELAQFLTPPSVSEGENLGGRTSGSLAWRLERGEISGVEKGQGFVFEVVDEDFVDNTFVLEYSSVADAYYKNRTSTGVAAPFISQWRRGIFECENIFRKEERDWKMVYLCRTEHSTSGIIRWKLNFSALSEPVRGVQVSVHSSVFENGEAVWTVTTDKQESKVCCGSCNEQRNSLQVSACSYVIIECKLESGRGSHAWQHAQIFRQSLTDTSGEGLFKVVVQR